VGVEEQPNGELFLSKVLDFFDNFISFIDDYSRTFVYFLISKSEVFNQLKEFKSLVEN